MFLKKNNTSGYLLKILIAPLDWGLGHATRCIPIIQHLLNNGATVIVAASGATKQLLQQEFPQLEFIELAGYNIRYSHSKWQIFTLIKQLPRVLKTVKVENKWLTQVIKTHNIQAVISDNRFGLYNHTVPCVYITHQLAIKTGNNFSNWLAQNIHYYFINKYSTCWVPDSSDAQNNLAGELSHPKRRPNIPVSYLGVLSRFKKDVVEKKYDVLFLLSGPEPQRSIFEKIVINQQKNTNQRILLVRGLPNSKDVLNLLNKNVTIHNHMLAAALNIAILQSKLVVCRSGYTTLMDLTVLQQKAVIVPTPGQAEQEYLAAYHTKNNSFYTTQQGNFNLSEIQAAVAQISFVTTKVENNVCEKVIDEFVATLIKNQ
jgi:uncharacterized protein (TIGR00661 family)